MYIKPGCACGCGGACKSKRPLASDEASPYSSSAVGILGLLALGAVVLWWKGR